MGDHCRSAWTRPSLMSWQQSYSKEPGCRWTRPAGRQVRPLLELALNTSEVTLDTSAGQHDTVMSVVNMAQQHESPCCSCQVVQGFPHMLRATLALGLPPGSFVASGSFTCQPVCRRGPQRAADDVSGKAGRTCKAGCAQMEAGAGKLSQTCTAGFESGAVGCARGFALHAFFTAAFCGYTVLGLWIQCFGT